MYVYLHNNLLLGITFTVRRVPIFFINVFFETIFISLYKINIFIYMCYIIMETF